ncbi:pyruvate kinase [Robertkochia solimangrovi]|uniref:pyruvate kinase n=1 Tax=Robertkochia solimangrovi TaxID=2213046 RepID=UPI00117E5715|nr:pyruvate kinase [Robertkochia solimangrovi]TRZ46197.1 hypothetical protein DMZ48_02760 [Robertkochia solimangrovi]
MGYNKDNIEQLLSRLDWIIQDLETEEPSFRESIDSVAPCHRKSALNLVHYTTLRKHDITELQRGLRKLGLTGFSHAEGHIKWSLVRARFILERFLNGTGSEPETRVNVDKAHELLTDHTLSLFGSRRGGRRVRIMVTQPTESAFDYELVHSMVENGMDCARINCAHDGPEIWEKIIGNVKKAAEEAGRTVKIAMDLAGPKIRTGIVTPGPRVIKIGPKLDKRGQLLVPARFTFVAEEHHDSSTAFLPVDGSWLKKLRKGDKINFRDTRGKKRKLTVLKVQDGKAIADCKKQSYLESGIRLKRNGNSFQTTVIGEIPALEQSLKLKEGDILRITKAVTPGENAKFDDQGNLLAPAHISCQMPEIFGKVKLDEPVHFDDGKIEGHVRESTANHFDVEITRARIGGAQLKAEKGINFPQSDLGIRGLTDDDVEDLAFVVKHADIVNFSFVSSKQDVEDLFAKLKEYDAMQKIGVILKIETKPAVDRLRTILLTAMQTCDVGVMIARGDLAVETGWGHMGLVQEEILAVCGAAHIPVIWATQVLENLAKKGLPSRSEITDATASLKSECVMLNKGTYINNAIQLLDQILTEMEEYRAKNEKMLPKYEGYMN